MKVFNFFRVNTILDLLLLYFIVSSLLNFVAGVNNQNTDRLVAEVSSTSNAFSVRNAYFNNKKSCKYYSFNNRAIKLYVILIYITKIHINMLVTICSKEIQSTIV